MVNKNKKLEVLTLRKSAIFSDPDFKKIKHWLELFLKGHTLYAVSAECGISDTTVRVRLTRLQSAFHHALTKQPALLACVLEAYPDFEVDVLDRRLDQMRIARHELLYCLELIENAVST